MQYHIMLRRCLVWSALSLFPVLTACPPAYADEIVGSGSFEQPEIMNGESVFSTITITQAGLIQDISITIQDIEHTAVGDLVAELRYLGDGSSDGGVSPAYLFFRPNVGDSMLPGSLANLNGDYTFTTDPDDRRFWSETAVPDNVTVDSSLPFFTSDANGDFLDLAGEDFFGGQDTRGEWQLVVSDATLTGNNFGSVQGWTLRFDATVIPEPSVFLLLCLSCCPLAICRHRRRTGRS